MNLGEAFYLFQKSMQEGFGFFFPSFWNMVLLGVNFGLLAGSRIIKLLEVRTFALNFTSAQISHSTGVRIIYHDQKGIMEQASTNVQGF